MLKEFIVFLRNFKLYLSLIFIISTISVFLLSNFFLKKGLDNPSIKFVIEPNLYPQDKTEQYLFKVNKTKLEQSYELENIPDFERFLEDIHIKIRKLFESNKTNFDNYKLINYKKKHEGDQGIWLWFEITDLKIFNDNERLLSELRNIIFNLLENEMKIELSFFDIVLELIEQKRKMVNTNLEMITFYPECKSLENIDNYQEKIFCVEVERRNKEIHNELETNKMEIKSFNFLDQYIQKRIDFYNKNNLIKISIVSKNDNKQRENSSYILSILISLFLTFLITLILFLLNKLRKN